MSDPIVISKKEFLKLTPYQRGYAVYMLGERDDQPHVPNEPNPYPRGTLAHRSWANGQRAAIHAVVDVEE